LKTTIISFDSLVSEAVGRAKQQNLQQQQAQFIAYSGSQCHFYADSFVEH